MRIAVTVDVIGEAAIGLGDAAAGAHARDSTSPRSTRMNQDGLARPDSCASDRIIPTT